MVTVRYYSEPSSCRKRVGLSKCGGLSSVSEGLVGIDVEIGLHELMDALFKMVWA